MFDVTAHEGKSRALGSSSMQDPQPDKDDIDDIDDDNDDNHNDDDDDNDDNDDDDDDYGDDDYGDCDPSPKAFRGKGCYNMLDIRHIIGMADRLRLDSSKTAAIANATIKVLLQQG